MSPILCTDVNAWAGEGHYFWDTDEELAHKWGRAHYFGNYVVVRGEAEIDETCFDLLGRVADYNALVEGFQALINDFGQKEPTLRQVILFLYDTMNLKDNYESIRLPDIESFNTRPNDPFHGKTFKITSVSIRSLTMGKRTVQINFFRKDSPWLDLKDVIRPA